MGKFRQFVTALSAHDMMAGYYCFKFFCLFVLFFFCCFFFFFLFVCLFLFCYNVLFFVDFQMISSLLT